MPCLGPIQKPVSYFGSNLALTCSIVCDNSFENGGAPATSGCDMVCSGNSSEICGGPNRLNVYDYQMQVPIAVPTTTTTSAAGSTTPSQPTGTSPPGAISGIWTWYGCQTEATGIRALSSSTFAEDTMTLEACAAFCNGYVYFGAEYARECYCGNSFNTGSVPAPATDCNFPCAGNSSELCGAGNRLSVYSSDGKIQPSLSLSSSSSAPTPTSTGPAPPPPTGLPAGWTYQGCWIDGVDGRILNEQQPDNQANSNELCAQTCAAAGYNISGTEYSVQCFCGNAIYNGGNKTVDSDCSMSCPGAPSEECGAGNRLSIYSNAAPPTYQPPTHWPGNANWTYQGCVQDNLNQERTFFWQLFFPNIMTPQMCLDQCASFGYAAAGLEYGDECYCGDPPNIGTHGAQFVDDSQCNIVCAGNASAFCGGGSLLSTYFWTGAPLYNWNFATGNDAGSYELLLNGVTVPLITVQAITGKVSFLSKWGTGPANETGAYELDLSIVDNFAQAWRPLHLKTDVFCSAGIVLPDIGGRILNVGGWSGESTYG